MERPLVSGGQVASSDRVEELAYRWLCALPNGQLRQRSGVAQFTGSTTSAGHAIVASAYFSFGAMPRRFLDRPGLHRCAA